MPRAGTPFQFAGSSFHALGAAQENAELATSAGALYAAAAADLSFLTWADTAPIAVDSARKLAAAEREEELDALYRSVGAGDVAGARTLVRARIDARKIGASRRIVAVASVLWSAPLLSLCDVDASLAKQGMWSRCDVDALVSMLVAEAHCRADDTDVCGATPLHLAAELGRRDVCAALLRHHRPREAPVDVRSAAPAPRRALTRTPSKSRLLALQRRVIAPAPPPSPGKPMSTEHIHIDRDGNVKFHR